MIYYGPMRHRYELTDDEWARIEPLLPPERKSGPGRPARENRLMVNAMVWIVRSGAPWRDLPERFGPWQSVYTRFSRWSRKGVWQKVAACLHEDPDLENLSIDSSYVRAHQHSAGGKGGLKNKQSAGAAGGLQQRYTLRWTDSAIRAAF
jgi:transposase